MGRGRRSYSKFVAQEEESTAGLDHQIAAEDDAPVFEDATATQLEEDESRDCRFSSAIDPEDDDAEVDREDDVATPIDRSPRAVSAEREDSDGALDESSDSSESAPPCGAVGTTRSSGSTARAPLATDDVEFEAAAAALIAPPVPVAAEAETGASPTAPSAAAGSGGECSRSTSARGGCLSAAESRRWQELAAEAAGVEIEAMHWDQAGSPAAAAECYRLVMAKLLEAAESVQQDHAVQRMLRQRAEEALGRAAALENVAQGAAGVLPEDQKMNLAAQGILASTLASTASSVDPDGRKASIGKDEAKIMSTAAAIGGAAGMLLMGPLSAASLGAMAAYATTREDPAGVAARKVSTVSLGVADSAFNKAVCSGLKAADVVLEEGRKRLLEGLDGAPSGGKLQNWCCTNKDKAIRAVAAVEALQGSLPRRKLSEEARRMRARYPDRVPVICERASQSDLPDLARKKFAVPGSMLCGEFKYIVHKQVTQASHGLAVDQTIYVFVGSASPKTSATMAELYEQHGADDGFLYVRYCAENTLGRRCACT